MKQKIQMLTGMFKNMSTTRQVKNKEPVQLIGRKHSHTSRIRQYIALNDTVLQTPKRIKI